MKRNPSIEAAGEEEDREMDWNPSIGMETLRIPPEVGTLEGFRRWTSSECFPEDGRIDFLAGELEIDLGFTYELELSHRSPGLRRRRSPRTRAERL
jgi:hypothetical protein